MGLILHCLVLYAQILTIDLGGYRTQPSYFYLGLSTQPHIGPSYPTRFLVASTLLAWQVTYLVGTHLSRGDWMLLQLNHPALLRDNLPPIYPTTMLPLNGYPPSTYPLNVTTTTNYSHPEYPANILQSSGYTPLKYRTIIVLVSVIHPQYIRSHILGIPYNI